MSAAARFTDRYIYGDGVSEASDGEYVRWNDFSSTRARLEGLLLRARAYLIDGQQSAHPNQYALAAEIDRALDRPSDS